MCRGQSHTQDDTTSTTCSRIFSNCPAAQRQVSAVSTWHCFSLHTNLQNDQNWGNDGRYCEDVWRYADMDWYGPNKTKNTFQLDSISLRWHRPNILQTLPPWNPSYCPEITGILTASPRTSRASVDQGANTMSIATSLSLPPNTHCRLPNVGGSRLIQHDQGQRPGQWHGLSQTLARWLAASGEFRIFRI